MSTGSWFTGKRVIGGPEAWLLWVLATTFVVWLFALQTGYAVLSPRIQDEVGLGIGQIGLAAAIYCWVFAVVQAFSGSLLERFGSRPLLAIAAALVTAGAFVYAGTADFATLAIAQTVLAVGASFGFIGAGHVGGAWFEAARYGLLLGLVQTLASLGSAIGQPLILAALAHLEWQQVVVAFASFGVLLTVLVVVFMRDPGDRETPTSAGTRGTPFGAVARDVGASFANLRVILSAVLAGASFGALLALGALWAPRLLVARGADDALAVVVTALAWLGLALGAPLVAVVSQRWRSRKWPAAATLALQAVATLLLIYLPTAANGAAPALMLAIGVFAGGHMLGFAIARQAVPRPLMASASAVVNGVCFLVGGLLIWLIGAMLPEDPQLADFQSVLWMLPIVVGVGALAAVLVPESRDVPLQ